MYFTLASELMPLIDDRSICGHAPALRRTVILSLAAAGITGATALVTCVIVLTADGLVEASDASAAARSIVIAERLSTLVAWLLLLLAAYHAGGALGADCSRRPRAALLIITSLGSLTAFVVLIRPMVHTAIEVGAAECGRTAGVASWVMLALQLAALIAGVTLALQINRWFDRRLLVVRRIVILIGAAGAIIAAPIVLCVTVSALMRSAAVSVLTAATALWCAWISIELFRVRGCIMTMAHDRDERVASIGAKTPTDSAPWASRA